MAKKDIYGCDPDGGAKAAGNEAVKRSPATQDKIGSKKDQSDASDQGDTSNR